MSDYHSAVQRLTELETRMTTAEASLAYAIRDIEILKAMLSERSENERLLFDRGTK